MFKLFKTIHYMYFFLRSIWEKNSGNFESSYVFIRKASRFVGPHNAKYYLFRSYVCILTERIEEGIFSMKQFCFAYFQSNLFSEYSRMNYHEKIWIEAFAEYMMFSLTGQRINGFGFNTKFTISEVKQIDFQSVRKHYKRLFPTSLYDGVIKMYELNSNGADNSIA